MKWSVLGLIVVGVVAAMCAAALVVALRAGDSRGVAASADDTATILIAKADLPRMTVVKSEHIITRTVPGVRSASHPADPAQVIGRALSVGVAEGQALREEHFIAEGMGYRLASELKPGTRAVCLSLPRDSALMGILYPGSVVDVLASFKIRSSAGGSNDTLSRTLLQGVQVLAIEGRTAASGSTDDDTKFGSGTRGNRALVTLMLTSKQAEVLQLAISYGSVSLSLRNPADETSVAGVPTALRELTGISEPEPIPSIVSVPDDVATAPPAKVPCWETVVIRGTTIAKAMFPMPDEDTDKVP